MNDAVTDLQTRVTYQEEAIEQLSATVARQQQELDTVRRELEQMKNLMREMLESMSPITGGQGSEPPPPHY